MIELRTVSKDYDGRRVIDNLSLEVRTSERVVLFGPSGCGKSTVLHLIAGLTLPDAGEILIDEELVARAQENSTRTGGEGNWHGLSGPCALASHDGCREY